MRSTSLVKFGNECRRLPCLTGASVLQHHHEGYITLEEFVKNREQLQKNRTNGEEPVLSGPAREGLALLQGPPLCGNCGHALTVRYRGDGGICPTYQCNLLRREDLATKFCMVFRYDLIDGVIAIRRALTTPL